VDAAIDTNVLIEIYSAHDLLEAIDKLAHLTEPLIAVHPDVERRRVRARESLLLAHHLHQQGTFTYALLREFTDKLPNLVPPQSRDEFETAYTTVFVHHLRDELMFPGWKIATVTGADDDVAKNGCDEHLVKFAARHKVPLISNETKPKGTIQRLARKHGARVVTPRQFWLGKMDEAQAVREILSALDRSRGELYYRLYLPGRPSGMVADFLDTVETLFRFVLLRELPPGARAAP
jgi:hypothetical protein